MKQTYNIAIAGTGYVGLSIAVLLAQHHRVQAVDILPSKIALLNARISPIVDEDIQNYLQNKPLNLIATTHAEEAYQNADFVIVSTPTNYNPTQNYFDTSSVDDVVSLVRRVNPDAFIVIKSTVPVGFIFFSPLNFCAKEKPYMITSIPHESLWEPFLQIQLCVMLLISLLQYYRKVH